MSYYKNTTSLPSHPMEQITLILEKLEQWTNLLYQHQKNKEYEEYAKLYERLNNTMISLCNLLSNTSSKDQISWNQYFQHSIHLLIQFSQSYEASRLEELKNNFRLILNVAQKDRAQEVYASEHDDQNSSRSLTI